MVYGRDVRRYSESEPNWSIFLVRRDIGDQGDGVADALSRETEAHGTTCLGGAAPAHTVPLSHDEAHAVAIRVARQSSRAKPERERRSVHHSRRYKRDAMVAGETQQRIEVLRDDRRLPMRDVIRTEVGTRPRTTQVVPGSVAPAMTRALATPSSPLMVTGVRRGRAPRC